ncbi:MAG: phosphatidate cytidylyltransferase [Anaerolineae bacterium]|nr:phosphatidate cytidylyltransferase [Anaerolineae bacterium]
MLLLPPVAVLVALGGVWFFALVAGILTLAVIEFCKLMRRGHFQPSVPFALAMLWVLLLDAQCPDWQPFGLRLLEPGITGVLLGSLSWQLLHRGEHPTVDWALAMAGPLYIGWCGAHFIRLRHFPEGMWWVAVTLAATWCADVGAYVVGHLWGHRPLAATLSPKKTWEGWGGGVVASGLAVAAVAALWDALAAPAAIGILPGALIGAFVGGTTLLGDLTVSMIKRHMGAKDTGTLFPGHGGALDRMDSLLWAGLLVYYLAAWITHS